MSGPLLNIGRSVVVWVSALLWMASAVFAQQKPITIETSTMQPSVVLGRPMLTWWDVKIQGSSLVVGKFRFNIKSEGYQLATLETEELTLNGPDQRIRVMLPAIDCAQLIDRLYVDISFEGKKFSGDLGQQILRVPFSSKTVYLGLVGESRTVRKRSAQRDKILERLKFEILLPETRNAKGEVNETDYVKTIFASIDPADFPAEPLAYCGYDLVVLMNEEFRNLRKPQLEGLLAWIKAGGSLYVEPNGVLEGYHVDFLKKLTADDHQGFVFQLDSRGKLPRESMPLELQTAAVKCGLGDAVIRTADPESEIRDSAEAWRTIAGPLWKSRFETAGAFPRQNLVGSNGQTFEDPRGNSDPYGFSMALFNRVSLRPAELLDRLMPEGVRMVPLSLLAAILLAFVILIGPGDYFGLGWIRLRKLTWITFPLATLGVTALTVWLSNLYMTGAETRRAVVVRDLGQEGELVRTNRFELLFVASTKDVQTPVEKGVFAKLDTGAGGMQANAAAGFVFAQNGRMISVAPNGQVVAFPGGQTMVGFPGSSTGVGGGTGPIRTMATQMEGRIPTQFTVTQDLAKWTPQINRVMSIPGSAASPEIDWDEWTLAAADAQTIRGHAVPPKLLSLVKARFGPKAMVACFTGKDGWAYDRSPGWRSEKSATNQPRYDVVFTGNFTGNGNLANSVQFEADLFRWIYQASLPVSDQGPFALTRQTTPKGGTICDDLTLLDTSDLMAWLLAIVVPENDDFVVYRKLMRFSR